MTTKLACSDTEKFLDLMDFFRLLFFFSIAREIRLEFFVVLHFNGRTISFRTNYVLYDEYERAADRVVSEKNRSFNQYIHRSIRTHGSVYTFVLVRSSSFTFIYDIYEPQSQSFPTVHREIVLREGKKTMRVVNLKSNSFTNVCHI